MKAPTKDSRLTTGFEPLDAAHEVQLGLLDSLREQLRQKRGAADVRSTVEHLIGYLQQHFQAEAHLMRQHAFPDLEPHLQEHDHALHALDRLCERLAHGEAHVSAEAVEGIERWLEAHIETRDVPLGRFLCARSGRRR